MECVATRRFATPAFLDNHAHGQSSTADRPPWANLLRLGTTALGGSLRPGAQPFSSFEDGPLGLCRASGDDDRASGPGRPNATRRPVGSAAGSRLHFPGTQSSGRLNRTTDLWTASVSSS